MENFVLDKALILERLGGDEEIYVVMADMFLHDVESYCEQLAAAQVAGKADVLQREAHTIKGLLATFADEVGSDMAQALEQKAKLGQVATLAPAVAALQQRVRLVAEAVRATVAAG